MCVTSVSGVSKRGNKQCNYGIFVYMVMDLLTNLHKCVNINGTEDSGRLGRNVVLLGQRVPTFRWQHLPKGREPFTHRPCFTSQKA